MGRLIDANIVYRKFYSNNMAKIANEILNTVPTVEAIPKDQYEARLRADMMAMLTDIKKEIDNMSCRYIDNAHYVKEYDVSDLIQEKINDLKESEDGKSNN